MKKILSVIIFILVFAFCVVVFWFDLIDVIFLLGALLTALGLVVWGSWEVTRWLVSKIP